MLGWNVRFMSFPEFVQMVPCRSVLAPPQETLFRHPEKRRAFYRDCNFDAIGDLPGKGANKYRCELLALAALRKRYRLLNKLSTANAQARNTEMLVRDMYKSLGKNQRSVPIILT